MSDREAFEVMMKTYFGDVVSLAHDGVVYTDGFVGAVHIGWLKGSLAEAERFKQEMRAQAAQAQAGEGEKVAPCDCIEKAGGFFVSNCYCGNSGDARDAQTYCVLRNATPPAVNQHLPEGYVLTPVEPTEAMIDAGVAVAFAATVHGKGGWNNYMRALYRAFIAAAQEVGNDNN